MAYFNVSSSAAVSGTLEIKLDGTSVSETHNVQLSATNNWVAFNVSVPQVSASEQLHGNPVIRQWNPDIRHSLVGEICCCTLVLTLSRLSAS